ncbi:putative ADP-ribosylation factor-binding protein GGA1 [Operophtera brumata]|uniref:Putative ADP-ribosylation factor-binding protein GGA1 n=1 Tax=Operophtera brumata TaxID=104452 RepID=A0A0L7L9P0_OPEBR|nr:putative ADP-ribosylation factor-binding protein GGA1 [Operophtera brumata]
MNVTLTSLEALILKATNESLPCPDPAALEAFCAVMRHSPDGPQMAAQTLAARIHIPHAPKALLALAMTDRCMRKCGPDFHAEVGKFRFLNEMIKLVSPKYLADRTAPEVRTRVLQLLHAWSIEYPQEFKFKVAYDMLKNQGVVKETPPPLPPEEGAPPKLRTKNAIFEDEEKSKLLQKLLQSKKPEDIQHANRLIKTMVREASSRREQELGTALDSAGLLSDMLEYAQNASPEEVQLIHELHSIVSKMRGVLDELASSTGESESLTNDILDEIHEKYEAFVEQQKQSVKPVCLQAVANSESLLDFAGAHPEAASNAKEAPSYEPKNAKNAIDELGEKMKVEGWNELDSLGEQLLKQSLPENAKRFDDITDAPSLSTLNNNDILDITSHVVSKEAIETNMNEKGKTRCEVRPLTDIHVTLESVQPSSVAPVTAFEETDGVTVVLHFCKDKPRADVNVVVISTTSRSGSPIDDYKLQCVVPKFVMTYTVDEDVCSEMGEVTQLPLDDIQ